MLCRNIVDERTSSNLKSSVVFMTHCVEGHIYRIMTKEKSGSNRQNLLEKASDDLSCYEKKKVGGVVTV